MPPKSRKDVKERWGIVVEGVDVIDKRILWGTSNEHYLTSNKPFKGVNRIIAFTTKQLAQSWLNAVVNPLLEHGNKGTVIRMPDNGTYSVLM